MMLEFGEYLIKHSDGLAIRSSLTETALGLRSNWTAIRAFSGTRLNHKFAAWLSIGLLVEFSTISGGCEPSCKKWR